MTKATGGDRLMTILGLVGAVGLLVFMAAITML
jgi:hypothetical protein